MKRLGPPVIAGVIAGAFILAAQSYGPYLEGMLFPVSSNTKLELVEDAGNGWTTISGQSIKRRECTFLELEWLVYDATGRAVKVPFKILEGNVIRGAGVFSFGPWLAHLTKKQVVEESVIVAHHRCHPFWVTETRFYP